MWPLRWWLSEAWAWVRAGWPHDYVPPLIALSTFAFAVWTYWSAKRRERFKMGIDLILKLGEQFDSEEKRKSRSEGAKDLAQNDIARSMEVDDVLDFFEDVGFLLRRRAIDLEAVDTFFAYWLEAWWRATTRYRSDKASPTTWKNVERMATKLEEVGDWESTRGRFKVRIFHRAAWLLSRKRKPAHRWLRPDDESIAVMKQETRLLVGDVSRPLLTKIPRTKR